MSDTTVRADIIIYNPPDYDGELHIQADKLPGPGKHFYYRFSVIQAATGEASAWDALVIVAQSIIEQDNRREGRKASRATRI